MRIFIPRIHITRLLQVKLTWEQPTIKNMRRQYLKKLSTPKKTVMMVASVWSTSGKNVKFLYIRTLIRHASIHNLNACIILISMAFINYFPPLLQPRITKQCLPTDTDNAIDYDTNTEWKYWEVICQSKMLRDEIKKVKFQSAKQEIIFTIIYPKISCIIYYNLC